MVHYTEIKFPCNIIDITEGQKNRVMNYFNTKWASGGCPEDFRTWKVLKLSIDKIASTGSVPSYTLSYDASQIDWNDRIQDQMRGPFHTSTGHLYSSYIGDNVKFSCGTITNMPKNTYLSKKEFIKL